MSKRKRNKKKAEQPARPEINSWGHWSDWVAKRRDWIAQREQPDKVDLSDHTTDAMIYATGGLVKPDRPDVRDSVYLGGRQAGKSSAAAVTLSMSMPNFNRDFLRAALGIDKLKEAHSKLPAGRPIGGHALIATGFDEHGALDFEKYRQPMSVWGKAPGHRGFAVFDDIHAGTPTVEDLAQAQNQAAAHPPTDPQQDIPANITDSW